MRTVHVGVATGFVQERHSVEAMIDSEPQFFLFRFSLLKGYDAPFQFYLLQTKLQLVHDLMPQDTLGICLVCGQLPGHPINHTERAQGEAR